MKYMNYLFLSVLLFFLSGTLHGEAQTRRALLIGLGEQADKSWARIHGDKDIALLKPLLQKKGYRDMQILINSQATKDAIVKAFETLAQNCRTDDEVYIHFSGHGQQMTDFDGDEMDGWDECWIPYDAYLRYGNHDDGTHHLTDDEVNVWLQAIRKKVGSGGKILVVVDACHSGDATRGEDDEIFRGVSERFVLPQKQNASFVRKNMEQWITLSACKDYQRNAEIKTTQGYFGKLTVALYSLMNKNKRWNNEELYSLICDFYDHHRGSLPQTPVMSGTTSGFRIVEMLK